MAILIALVCVVTIVALGVRAVQVMTPRHWHRLRRVGPPGESLEDWISRRKRTRTTLIRRPGEEPVEHRSPSHAEERGEYSPTRSSRYRRRIVLAMCLIGLTCLAIPLVLVFPPFIFAFLFIYTCFFVVLFAVQFLRPEKFVYAVYAVVPVLVLGFVQVVFGLVVFGALAAVLMAVLVACLIDRSRPFKRRVARVRKLASKRTGDKTRGYLGSPTEGWDHAREGRHLKPIGRTKAKGVYFRMP